MSITRRNNAQVSGSGKRTMMAGANAPALSMFLRPMSL